MFILVSMQSDEFAQAGPIGISNIAVQSRVVMVSVQSIEHAKQDKLVRKAVVAKHITEVHVQLVSTARAGLPGPHGQHVE